MSQIVLEDELLMEYFKFKNNEPCDTKIIQSLFNYYKPCLTNTNQLKRIGRDENPAIMQQIAQQRNDNLKLEELVQETSLKLILSKNKSEYPFVNVSNPKEPIESNYTATFKDTPRRKAIEHIKALCQTAKTISIYDNFLDKCPDQIFDLFPKSSFDLYYDDKIEQSIILNWKKRNPSMTTHGQHYYKKLHDRYLLIDNNIEVILTSGFDYLFLEDKDFTYIVRMLPKQ
jgi:hypothetical protein